MNYLEAVKELVNNPKALAITFPGREGAKRIELRSKGRLYNYLAFPSTDQKKQQTVVACSPDFLLREDFSIEYKVEKVESANAAYLRGIGDGMKMESENARREANAVAANALRVVYEELMKTK